MFNTVWWTLQDDYPTVFVSGLYLCFDGWKFGSNSINLVVISAGIMGQFYVLFGFCCKVTCGQPDEYNGFVLFNKVWFQRFPYKACIIYTEFWFRYNQKVNKLLGRYFLLKRKTFTIGYQNGLFFWVFPLASPRQILNILFVILICDISFDVDLYSGDLYKKFEFVAVSRNLEKKWRTLSKILTLKKRNNKSMNNLTKIC